jgi:hypothetical protein
MHWHEAISEMMTEAKKTWRASEIRQHNYVYRTTVTINQNSRKLKTLHKKRSKKYDTKSSFSLPSVTTPLEPKTVC